MAITKPQGNYTGLLGYNRDYEYFGDSNLPFRIVEQFSYEVYDNQLDQTADLSSYFKTQFAAQLALFSGDINITSLEYPNSENFKEDGVRIQKYNITFETRTTGAFFNSSRDGHDNTKNSGLASVVSSYHDVIKDFSESFSFSTSQDGAQDYSHSLGFSLRTGNGATSTTGFRSVAQTIAQTIFNTETGANLSVVAFPGYTGYAESDAKQYFTESYDDLNHSYSFEKTRSVLPFGSTNYTYSMDHSIDYSEDGYFQISENIISQGKLTFDQALNGFNSLINDSSGRCAEKIAKYYPVVQNQTNNTSVVSSGVNRIRLSKVYKKPDITVEGTVVYTNNPQYLSGISRTENLSIDREANGVINMNHSFNYSLFSYIDGQTDDKIVSGSSNIVQVITGDRIGSSGYCQSIYDSLTGLTGQDVGSPITLLKTDVTAPERGKSYSASFSYTDNPIYDMTRLINPFSQAQIGGFKKMEVSVDETEPKDIIEEYKIINRDSKQSVLSYGYQQEPGSAKVSCRGQLARQTSNLMEDPYYPTGEAVDLLKFSKSKFLDHVMVDRKLYNYFLQNANYSFDSENTFNIDLNFVFTKKR